MLQQPWAGHAAGGPFAVSIVRLPGVTFAPQVKQHVGRAGIEAANRLSGHQYGNVGHAPQVQYRAWLVAAKYRSMEGGYQGGTLAAGRDIACAKIGNDIDAGQFGQQGGCI